MQHPPEARSVSGCFGRRLAVFLFLCGMFGSAHTWAAALGKSVVTIGALSFREPSITVERWLPTLRYLNQQLPEYRFRLVPLDFDQLSRAIRKGELDFVLTNPGHYVGFEVGYGLSRIATLENHWKGTQVNTFGGVIFTRADRKDILGLRDLKGKTFLAAHKEGFGGFRMAWGELDKAGIDPFSDFAKLEFAGLPLDKVVYAVRDGKVDAGTVRTGVLERMAAEGRIDLHEFRILNPRHDAGFPFLHSTELYPEWPFSRLKYTPNELARKVAVALLQMPPAITTDAAHSGVSWVAPLDYRGVHELYKRLRVEPYADYGGMSLGDILKKYALWLTLFGAAIVLFLGRSFWIERLVAARTRELSRANERLEGQIREREAAMEALRKSEEKTSAIVDMAVDGIVTIDERGKVRSANPAAEKIFGYSGAELAGRNISDIIHLDLGTREERPGRADGPQDEGVNGPVHRVAGRKGDGSEFFAEIAVSEMELGQKRLFLGIVRDITRRIRDEEERDLLTKQLQQAQKMEAIGQLTGGIAHDFNNILACIMGYSGLALERYQEDGDEKLLKYLTEISQAGERARDLIAQMMAFSRVSQSESSPISITVVVKEVAKLLEPTLPATISLRAHFDEPLPKVLIDPIKLHQIVLNLCINARDAMHGKGVIEIGLAPARLDTQVIVCTSCHEAFSGAFVELTVSDSGSGIDPLLLAKIFDPFFTTKDVGKGTGMGLSVVHGITHQCGGHIVVDMTKASGTTFRIFLPAHEPDGSQAVQEKGREAPERGSGSVLVVDDEVSIVNFLSELLEGHGYRVTAATNGREALERFRGVPRGFDLVVTDQTMPEMTGAEMVAAMLEQRPDLPVILCSGYSDDMDEARAAAMNIRRYFPKPVPSQDLLRAVGELIGTGRENH